jgi:hypothetical protein
MNQTLIKGSHWYTTGVPCKKCKSEIYQEMTEEGVLVDNFSCLTPDCDFTKEKDADTYIYENSKLSKHRGIKPCVT